MYMYTQGARGYLEGFLGRVKVDLDVEVLHQPDDLLQVQAAVAVAVSRPEQLLHPPAATNTHTAYSGQPS